MASRSHPRAALGVSLVALIAGLLLGPGYYVYANFFSGALVAEQRVFERQDGAAGLWMQPFAFELSPEMNPVAVVAQLRLLPEAAPRRRTARVEVVLRRGEATVWQEAASVLRPESDSRSESRTEGEPAGRTSAFENLAIRRFEVAEAGTYALTAALVEPQEVPVAEITLRVRRNVIEASLPLLLGGGACLILGLFGLVMAGRKRRRAGRA